jgi:hypothetical protein
MWTSPQKPNRFELEVGGQQRKPWQNGFHLADGFRNYPVRFGAAVGRGAGGVGDRVAVRLIIDAPP